MQKKLLKKIIKANQNKKKSLDEIIDEFIKTQSQYARGQLEDYLSSLFVYINKNYDEIPKEQLFEIVSSKLEDLSVNFDTKDIDDIYASIALETSVGATKVVFDKIDTETIKTMRNGFLWASDKYNTNTQDLLKDTIEEAFKGELKRAELSTVLKDKFQGIIDKDENYFKLVADNIISQSQSLSTINQALKYDVKAFKVRARIDGQTSDFCRAINGRIISSEHLKKQLNNILNSKSIDDKKIAAPWQNKAIFSKLPKNIGMPPYHGRCRTQLDPVWINESTKLDKQTNKEYKIKNTKNDKRYKLTHIDNTGLEVNINKKNYNKITQGKHQISEKQLVTALNDIKYKAPAKITKLHPNEHIKSIALSNDGYVFVFESNELVSCIYDKGNSYFNNNSIPGKITDVSTGKTINKVKKWHEYLI